MKRYALFAYSYFCPSGGMDDFIKSNDSFDYLFQLFLTSSFDCGQIVDTTTFEVFKLQRE